MSKIVTLSNPLGFANLPCFAVVSHPRKKYRSVSYFGKVIYSPAHHRDSRGRMLPAQAARNGYAPSRPVHPFQTVGPMIYNIPYDREPNLHKYLAEIR